MPLSAELGILVHQSTMIKSLELLGLGRQTPFFLSLDEDFALSHFSTLTLSFTQSSSPPCPIGCQGG